MKIKLFACIVLAIILFVGQSLQVAGQTGTNWTHFRGNALNGLAEDADYPVSWSDSSNILWKTEIRGRGWSSPVIFGNQVWLTSATPDGHEMFVICVDKESGEIIYDIDMFQPDSIYRIHAVNSYATPTSAIEDGFVYVHFGRYGTGCIDTSTGKIVWTRTDMQCEHVQGPGSSLFLHDNKLIVHMEGTDVQDIYALDKRSGETIWIAKRDRKFLDPILEIGKKAYVTPIVVEVNGRELMITNGSASCDAFDIGTGERVWYIPQGEDSTISMPVEYNGTVYFYTSFVSPPEGEKYCELWAVDPNGEGDLTHNIKWRLSFPILQLLTPVIYEELLYTIDTRSILHCIDATSGETVWTERLKGKYNSSPIVANGNIYVNTTRGETTVFKAGPVFQLISDNQLDGEIWSTPAFVDGSIFIRTSKWLYRVEKR